MTGPVNPKQMTTNDFGVVAPPSLPMSPGCLEGQVAIVTGQAVGLAGQRLEFWLNSARIL